MQKSEVVVFKNKSGQQTKIQNKNETKSKIRKANSQLLNQIKMKLKYVREK